MTLVNQTISHYRIVSKIGAGGMGEVYLAQDTKLDRKVALKILPEDLASNRDRMERFVREAKSAAALNHPNIAHIYEIGESDGTHFIAMEFIDGKTLRQKIHVERTPLSRLLKYLNQVAEGLARAHAVGIVHRDLKPDNIMIARDDYAKVLDFGLAKLVEPQRGFGPGDSSSSEIATALMQQPGPPAAQPGWGGHHSTPGMVMGTIGYMSPEQASGRVNEIDHRSDIFSLGCILFEAATGQRAFEGKDALDSLHKIVHAPTPQLKDVNPLATDDLQRVVRRCLAKEPEKRYQSMKEVALEIDDLQQELRVLTGSEYSGRPTSSATVTTSGTTRADEGFWVAVLPFKYRGSNVDLEALAEGLSEDIVTGLSRFSYLRVIARSSTLRFTTEAADIRTVGKELGARYVMEGNLRQAGSMLRVAVQLVDANRGAHLWAETYERSFSPEVVFQIQDDLVPRIVSTVADWYGVLPHSMSETVRLKPAEQLSPYESVLRGLGYYERVTAEEHAVARPALERAVQQAPGNADGWAILSLMYGEEHRFGYNVQPDPLGRSLQAARRAVDAAPSNHFAYLALAQALFFRKEFDAFRTAAERAIALNPMDGSALEYLGHLIAFAGDWEKGCELAERARLLNPNHPGWYWAVPFYNAYRNGDYVSARAFALKLDMPTMFFWHIMLAAVYGQLGELQAASNAVQELLALKPDFVLIGRRELGKWYLPDLVEHLIEGLRKAGLEMVGEENVPSTFPAGSPSSEMRSDEGFWVAVLPFKSSGTSLEVNTLAEGLSEEIVTGLSRFSYLRVIARSSTLRYASETSDVRTVGRELGARYVMEGSLRQAGTILRVAVQLVDATSGAHLWAETYDRPFSADEIFAIQDDLVPRIVSTIADQYGVLPHNICEALRGRKTDELSPYEVLMRFFDYTARFSPESHAETRANLEQAVQNVSSPADCWAMLSDMYADEYKFGFNPQPDPLGRALAAACRAVDAAPSNSFAYVALAQVLFFRKEFDAFRTAAERALALNPMDGATTAYMGNLIAFTGDWEKGCKLVERATQMNPHHPGWYWTALVYREYLKGDYREALNIALRINMPGFLPAHIILAAVYGQLGESRAAQKARQDLLALRPDIGLIAREELGKWYLPELVDHLIDGLRKAGLEIAEAARVADAPPATETGTPVDPSPSIAVLPFTNISNDAGNEYFCDGLAEELLNAFAKIDELKVAARTSAFSFKGKNTNVGEIGHALGVRTVLEGSVRKAGDRVRISVQLINVADGYHLWSERYDREMHDIFDIQDEISLAIVAALKVKLLGEQKAAVLKRHTENTKAYQLYLKGRFFVNQRTSASLRKAIEYFNQAISVDANYALGYAGLADAYLVLGVPDAVTEALSPLDSLPRARAAAEKALQIDNSVGETYPSLAHVKWKERDWAGAAGDYDRGIKLNPNYPIAHFYYAVYLASLGRQDEAVKEISRARELDPLSLPVNATVTYVLYLGRQYDEAIDAGKKTLEMDATFSLAHQRLGLAYVQKQMYIQGQGDRREKDRQRAWRRRGDDRTNCPTRR